MDVSSWVLLPYAGVFVAAIVEGEITYIAAAALVAEGVLNPIPVLVAGALGASAGDQAYFYLFRRRLSRWAGRYPAIQRAAAPFLVHVRRNDALVPMLIRFAPGLRIALAMACAWVDVPAAKFSLLNLLSSFVWAVLLLAGVAWLGPTFLERFGLGGWKGAVVVGLLLAGLLNVLAARERRRYERLPPPAGSAADGSEPDKE